MPISLSYDQTIGKLSVTGLTAGNTYVFTKDGDSSPMYITGITGTSYSNYFIEAGITYTIILTDQANVSAQFTQYTDYNDSFLINSDDKKNQQVSIIYNEIISSFKPVRKDVLIETIGSKYPFIIRNASINYKTMEFSGTITAHMDIENISGYGLSTYYSNYNTAIKTERFFRDWFESWINDGYPKIMKTPTEGLRLVRVHNVSFTPVKELGRLIYAFTCSITEIADYTAENLIKYKFISNSGGSLNFLYPRELRYPSDSLFPY